MDPARHARGVCVLPSSDSGPCSVRRRSHPARPCASDRWAGAARRSMPWAHPMRALRKVRVYRHEGVASAWQAICKRRSRTVISDTCRQGGVNTSTRPMSWRLAHHNGAWVAHYDGPCALEVFARDHVPRRIRFVRAAWSRRAVPRTESNGSTLAHVAQCPPSRHGPIASNRSQHESCALLMAWQHRQALFARVTRR